MGVQANDILAGIGGGFEGLARGLSYREENKIKREQITSRADIAKMNADLKEWLTQQLEARKLREWETPSGNVVATQEGATTRTGMTVAGAAERTGMTVAGANERAGMTIAGANTRAAAAEQGRNTRWGIPSGVALLGSETTRRGQNLSYALGTAGQGITADTAAQTSADRRYAADQATARAKMRPRTGGLSFSTAGLEPSAVTLPARPDVNLPVEPVNTAPPLSDVAAPVAPGPGATPIAPRAVQDQLTQLELQGKTLLQRFRAEKDPARKKALAAELVRISQALISAQGK